VRGLILAAVTPDNTPGGSVLTFAFPVALFCVVAVILYLLFSRPHGRIPARRATAPAHAVPSDPQAVRAVAVAGGLSTAAGGGAAESHLEPAGPALAPDAAAGSVSGQGGSPDAAGSVSGPGGSSDDVGQPGQGTSAADGTEASE
jgi:hypothetical protein